MYKLLGKRETPFYPIKNIFGWLSIIFLFLYPTKAKTKTISFIDQEQIGTTLIAEEDQGFIVSNTDGSYSMNLRARIQNRFTQNFYSKDRSLEQTEFVVRRLRLSLRGNVHNPDWRYYIQFGFATQDNEADVNSNLRDAVISYVRFRDMNINFGQMKVTFSRQRVSSSGNLQMPDRSRVSGELNLDRDVGISLTSVDLFNLNHFLGYALGVFSGEGRNRRSSGSGVLAIGKIFLNPFGEYDYLSEADFHKYTSPKFTLGLAAAKNHQSIRKQSTIGDFYRFSRFTYEHFCADFVFKWMGFYLSGEYLWRKANKNYQENPLNNLEKEYSRSAQGYFVQGSYLFPFFIEIVLRYGELFPMAGTDPNLNYSKEFGGGISYYLNEHMLKIQADYHYYWGNFALDRKTNSQEIRLQIQMVI